ncbi:MAG TPA: sulfate ABC transporter substrate-binding protein [Cellvibrionaceae bacterium]
MNAFKKIVLITGGLLLSSAGFAKDVKLLNVSYDPTRELYREYNAAFGKYWLTKTGDNVSVEQSHGGSGAQSRAVIDGLQADVVTFALAGDIDPLFKFGNLIPENWQARLPQNSAPYTSTIVFLVRKGNPKKIKDWDDLIAKNIEVITPNPKTSGGARWNYLAAWGFAKKKFGSDQAAQDFVKKLYKNVPVLDSGARGSTTTFVQRQIGDVLLTWENEAYLAVNELGADKVEIVVPSVSILAEASITVVDKYATAHGTREVAEEYLKYLYSKEGQTIIAKNFYRPRDKEVAAAYASKFPNIELFTIEDFGGWKKAQPEHFGDGGIFDKIYQ